MVANNEFVNIFQGQNQKIGNATPHLVYLVSCFQALDFSIFPRDWSVVRDHLPIPSGVNGGLSIHWKTILTTLAS